MECKRAILGFVSPRSSVPTYRGPAPTREITAALDAIKSAGGMTERPGKMDVREVARKP